MDQELSQFASIPTDKDEFSTTLKIVQVEINMNNDISTNESHPNISVEKFNQETNLKKSNKPELEDWLDSILND